MASVGPFDVPGRSKNASTSTARCFRVRPSLRISTRAAGTPAVTELMTAFIISFPFSRDRRAHTGHPARTLNYEEPVMVSGLHFVEEVDERQDLRTLRSSSYTTAGHPPEVNGPQSSSSGTQKTRIGISAGSISSDSISSSSLTSVMDAPAMSRDVQYSPT